MQHLIPSLASRLAAQFSHDILSASALVHGGAAVVARQAERLRTLRPRTIVEVGTRHGAFAALLSGLADTVFTLDLHQSIHARQVLDFAGAANVVPLIVADDPAKGRLLDALDFDLAFIDGDHSREGVALDFAHTRRCGIVLFHDYADPGFHGVTEFVDSLTHGTIVRDAPFAWWFAPGVALWVPLSTAPVEGAALTPLPLREREGGSEAPEPAAQRRPSWRDGTPFCTAGLRCR
ncbi:MAG: class I SAM-dependent methyltransferase [Planctomycetes bacterium]|nr:class I SAM-dependent methyltransferase [Planctomycetota bacterium]